MKDTGIIISKYSLKEQNIEGYTIANWNLSSEVLVELTLQRNEGKLATGGSLAVDTGKYTGRSPSDKYTVEDATTKNTIDWGKFNQRLSEENFDKLYTKCLNYIKGKEIYVSDVWGGADSRYRLSVRFITTRPYHCLFVKNMFIEPTNEELSAFNPNFTVIQLPELLANPTEDGTNSETFIVVNLTKKIILIGGTEYSGELKKGIFGVLNYFLPEKDVMPMHCSANVGMQGDVTVFFGLSGTGKTTLSSDPQRALIGDDEHGWSDTGIFNFEGGCYAKVIDLNATAEPEIFKTTHTFGTILENIVMNEHTRVPDLSDKSKTENTRSSYPLTQVSNVVKGGVGGHASNIIMLTCDAFGVLPPISKLSPEQAMYYFLSGYTAKVAGTERGVTEPSATFSTCFGAPFMPRHPYEYANLLAEKIKKHNAQCYLVNTGWSGGSYGKGARIKLGFTRAMINSALNSSLLKVNFVKEPHFGLMIPKECQDVPNEILMPENTWADKTAYKQTAQKLINLFKENFKKYESKVSQEVLNAEIGK